jgi:hypothetical protein
LKRDATFKAHGGRSKVIFMSLVEEEKKKGKKKKD